MGNDLAWTSAKPTTPGAYWIRNARVTRFPSWDLEQEPVVVRVYLDNSKPFEGDKLRVAFPGNDEDEALRYVDGEWAGPIPRPGDHWLTPDQLKVLSDMAKEFSRQRQAFLDQAKALGLDLAPPHSDRPMEA